jgi:hypothetical protein
VQRRLGAALLIAPLATCWAHSSRRDSPSAAATQLWLPSNLGAARGPLSNGQAVQRAVDTIHGGRCRVTSIEADGEQLINVQEPKRHVNVDRYVVAPEAEPYLGRRP